MAMTEKFGKSGTKLTITAKIVYPYTHNIDFLAFS